MPQENAESFKGFIDAFNRRDAKAIVEVVDTAVEWRPAAPVALGGGDTVYRGHTGVLEGLRDLHGAFAELQIEISELREVGDQVVGTGHIRTRGKGSGAELDTPFGAVMEFRDGRAIQIRSYLDPKDGLDAAGLAE